MVTSTLRLVKVDSTGILERFGDRIEQTGDHWIWKGPTHAGGYPAVMVNGRKVEASRLVYQMAHGAIPPGRRVRHQCRNRLCVNPAHLGLGVPPVPVEPLEVRFWRMVQKGGGCWLWRGKRDKRGYGLVWVAGRWRRAHRVSFELTKGPVLQGASVCHTCDNPGCVNPGHLYAGSAADNMRDKKAKGRQTRGEGFPQAKLSEAKVREMRRAYATGAVSRAALARRYRVAWPTIDKALRGKSWRHVSPELQAAA